ncbi:ABC transporter ATP-binding protein [Actinomyces howellii]|uniref:Lipoprotein-releasing system ATP-binding protein LolD n=1 Tax=Actinomyces howellii TaxID=52771 RepID=A0A3S4UXA5_9ACTO|nr:Lipoprotein-releasing system ATP-binding protein LolD [Actinomyces howellii]
MGAVIEASSVVKRYGSREATVLDGVDLVVERGEFVTIMGSSGAGKSTFLYCLSGVDQPTSGRVVLDGTRIDGLGERSLTAVRRRVGFVFQQINLLPHLSLRENVALPGLNSRRVSDRRRALRRADELLAKVGLADAMGRPPSQASGGEQQRAAIARALLTDPVVLFADEPTGALHSSAGRTVLDLLEQANAEGQTTVMVTHDPRAAARGDRVIYLRDGRIVAQLDAGARDVPLADREAKVARWLQEMGW